MDHREKLLSIVKEKGPLLPAQINRALNTNVLFASAMLSEMVDAKKLKLSHMKVGGSPLYYCSGQEPQLAEFSEKLDTPYLNAFNELKKHKVMRDRDLQPSVRVSLREIKDFAVPLEVTANGSTDLFWKYYMVNDDEAKTLIKSHIESKMPKQSNKQDLKKRSNKQHKHEVQAKISSVDLPEPSHGGAEQRAADLSRPESRPESRSESRSESKSTGISMTEIPQNNSAEFSYDSDFSFSTAIDTDEPVKLEAKKENPITQQKTLAFPEGDDFFNHIKSFFDTSEIKIKDFGITKKGQDFDFEVLLPTNIGHMKYYCKAKDKKKISEFDLHSAFVEGHIRKLPIFFLTKGELTSKAKDILHRDLKSIFFKRV